MKYAFIAIMVCIVAGCNQNNVNVDDSLGKHFKAHNVTGTFGLLDNGKAEFTVYNLSRFRDSAYLPASTFKIVNSLIGIETGRIVDENMVIPWDGQQREIQNWNQDLNMTQAFKFSSVPYYQEVARRIGKDTMQRWLDSLGYASRYSRAEIKTVDNFWLDNSIKITADEQLGLVKKLYFDELPFQKRTTRIVKEAMVMEKNSNYILAYKTGLGNTENGNALGWIVGWIEENKHPYFFAMNVEGPADTEMVKVRMDILKKTLDQLGFLKGNM
ncbi:class D beta-lactamase [Aridibaculum aurantiacum]|uniref:class D beta-lactamase n=1 Tax=Aridibaculum aurantiacum TaxID=2810307 RepID=UPI001A97B3B2|nr:class D beta-lactamase [Aridibaculum aurantiacum]